MANNGCYRLISRLIISPVFEKETSSRALASIKRRNDCRMIGIIDILVRCGKSVFGTRTDSIAPCMTRTHFYFLSVESWPTLEAVGHAIQQPFMDETRH